eukprot:11838664-Alexandrium_andersonii.AAC.1
MRKLRQVPPQHRPREPMKTPAPRKKQRAWPWPPAQPAQYARQAAWRPPWQPERRPARPRSWGSWVP